MSTMGYRDINVTTIGGDELMTTSVSLINISNTTTAINTSEAMVTTECHLLYFCEGFLEDFFYIAIDKTREVIFWLGVIFNTIFFVVVFSNRKLWTSTFLLLALLNFFDSFFLVVDYCDFISHYLTGDNICFWYFFRQFSNYGSLITVTFISIERHNAICKPFKYTGRQNLGRGFLVTSCIFIVSVLLATPKFTTVCLVDGVDKIDASSPTAVYLFIANACIDLVAYSICLIIVFIAYGRIIYTLKKNNSAMKANRSKNLKRQNLISMLVVNSAVFFICTLPKAISYAIYVYILILEPPWVEESTVSDYIEYIHFKYHQFVWIFISINASINSIIYTALSSDYREGLRNLGRMIVSCCRHDSRAAVKLSSDRQLMDIKDKSKNPIPIKK